MVRFKARSYLRYLEEVGEELCTEYCCILFVFDVGTRSQHGTEIVIVNSLVISHQELAPPFLARLALHLVLVNSSRRIELGKLGLKVFVNLVIHLC